MQLLKKKFAHTKQEYSLVLVGLGFVGQWVTLKHVTVVCFLVFKSEWGFALDDLQRFLSTSAAQILQQPSTEIVCSSFYVSLLFVVQ